LNFLSLFKRKLIYKLKKKISVDKDNLLDNSLDNLFHFYGSDKAELFKLNNSQGHGFSKYYIKHLEKLKKNDLNILELGSYAGASAVAFSKYFTNSKIFCLDINISNFKYTSKNIDVYGLNIRNIDKVKIVLKKIFLKNNFNKFDLIIDDGSHKLSDILFCFNFFFKYVKKGGIFIIEDFKHPNYFSHNKDVDDILVEDLLKKISLKEQFQSSFFNIDDQQYLFSSIDTINTYKGNLDISDICFISKKLN